MNSIVSIYSNEARAGTYLIAQGFERKHQYILELIEKYNSGFKDFGGLKRQKISRLKRDNAIAKGRKIDEYLLNEDQVMFLGTLFRNSKIVIQFKKNLVKEFSKTRRELAALKSHKSTEQYQITRDAGKIVRRETTDVMQQFVIYAEEQGSSNANRYYSSITAMANGFLFTVKTKFKNLRNVMTTKQLMTISSAEQIIEKALVEGMVLKKPYKEIYQDIKSKISLFAELHGRSEVVDQQLIGGAV